ncbi:hypothetical protein [Nocardia crassostreae]|uniref:hypothetical protein n=1 Tax=Nocardia crassostreae TaxID=53428 RepID=UPI000832F454|nr:hypothetical protein [Nocardia crassostreae]
MSRHRELKTGAARRALFVGAIPLALAVACSATSNPQSATTPSTTGRSAAPQSPGATTPPNAGEQPTADAPAAQQPVTAGPATGERLVGQPPSIAANPHQPGVTAPAADRPSALPGPVQPGVTTPPRPRADYPVPANYRPVPNADTAPPVNIQALHAPVAVDPVAPIAPPPRTLRIGAFSTPVGDDVSNDVLNPVNTGAAAIEAGIATGLNSVGINASRSDKIAGLTVAGAVTGAAAGAAIAGVPAAVVGAVPGAVIGAGVGTVAGAVIGGIAAGIPTSGAASGPGAVAGALIGAGVGAAAGGVAGAAALGIPAAVVGGVIGGVIGGAAGTAFGAAV